DKKNKKPPYKFEIEMLKAGKFNPQLKDIIMQA
ncbi:deoxyribonuclease IV, partial [Virgibacillus halodenitrificans]|nr:deoxyribonuclease IV [Virgibacillus halodenitrificans]